MTLEWAQCKETEYALRVDQDRKSAPGTLAISIWRNLFTIAE